MKKNNILKVVLLAILVAVVFTWIFPTTQYDQTNNVVDGQMLQVGVFTLTSYVRVLFNYFLHILLTVFAIGAFYGVAYKIPAYRYLLDTIVLKFKGKEKVFLISIMIITAVIVSLTGFKLGVGILFVFPFIISLVLLMGYNKLVAASVTVGSAVVGMIGATLSTTANDYINYVLETSYDAEIVSKIFLLAIGLTLLIYNVLIYASKTKNDTDKVLAFVPTSIEYDEVEVVKKEKKTRKKINIDFSFITKFFAKITKPSKEKKTKKTKDKKKDKKKVVKKETKKVEKKSTKKEVTKKVVAKKEEKKTASKKAAPKKKVLAKKSTKTKANDNKSDSVKVIKGGNKVKIWPFIVVFDLLFLIIVLSVFDWSTIFKTTWPTDALNAIKEFEIFGFPIFDKLLGASTLYEFGNWSLDAEIPIVIFIFTGILALMYKLSFNKFIDGILDGMKKAFVPAITMFIAYLVLIICVQNQLHIAKFFLGITSGLNVITMSITLMFSGLINMDIFYVAQTTLPYVRTVISDASLYPTIAVMTQAMYGLIMLIAPTSVILIGVLSYLDIPYLQWIKHIWKLFVELLVVLLIFFLIVVLI